MTPARLTFSALLKGERFRIWRDAGTGINTGIPAKLLEPVYTKVARGACKDDEGQWLNIKGSVPVVRV